MLQLLVQLDIITMRYLVLFLSLSVLALEVSGNQAEEADIRLTPLTYFGNDIGLHAVEFRRSPSPSWSAFYVYRLSEPEHIRRKASIICHQAGKSEPSYLVRLDLVSVANVFDNPSQEWYELSTCQGDEERIQDCRTFYSGLYERLSDQTKEYKYAIGVICNPAVNTETLRLIGGANDREGVVYSFSAHSWGPVCAQYNHHLPNIICKELGFNGRSQWASADMFEAPPYQPEPVQYFNGTCAPGAERLDNCSHVPIYYMKGHLECLQLAVICDTAEADVRLVDGEYDLSKGLVEFRYKDEWRPICVDLTESNLPGYYSELVCKLLGYTNGSSHAIAVEPSQLGYEVISSVDYIQYPRPWFDVAGCNENTTSLEDCQISPLGSSENCKSRTGFAYMGVACNGNATLPVRLVEGNSPSEGIVEVYSETYDYWGTVLIYADFNNDSQSKYSEIICRQLGIDSKGASYMIAAEYFNASWSGYKLHGVWLHVLSCSGDEERIEDCRWKLPMGAYPDANPNIGYVMLAVVCDPGPTPRPLRLTGSPDPTRGRVEINNNGRWNRICAEDLRYHLWTGSIADVMCHQMGFSSWSYLLTPGTFGRGSGPILMTSANCTGKESSFDECFHGLLGRQPQMECQDITLACNVDNPILLRLIGGSTPSEGILEVNFNGQAGRICDRDWNQQNTMVTCRQLGFPDGISYAIPQGVFATEGQQPWRTWLQSVSCSGDEANILNCPHSPWGFIDHETYDTPSVSLVCNDSIPESRLTGTGFPNKGVVEIYFREEWGLVCGDSQWTDTEATVVCRQLGYSGLAFATSKAAVSQDGLETNSYQGRRAWLESVDCDGSEEALAQCHFKPWKFTDKRRCSEGSFVSGVICAGSRTDEDNLSTKDEPRGYQDGSISPAQSQVLHPIFAMILLGIIVILILVVLILSVMVYFLRKRDHHYIESAQTEPECCESNNETNM